MVACRMPKKDLPLHKTQKTWTCSTHGHEERVTFPSGEHFEEPMSSRIIIHRGTASSMHGHWRRATGRLHRPSCTMPTTGGTTNANLSCPCWIPVASPTWATSIGGFLLAQLLWLLSLESKARTSLSPRGSLLLKFSIVFVLLVTASG